MIKTLLRFAIFGVLLFSIAWTTSCNEQSYEQGGYLYQAQCSSCHMDDGTGLGKNIPSLVQSDYIQNNRLALPCLIRQGIGDEDLVTMEDYKQVMPAFPHLSEAEISNIINYMLSEWNEEVTLLTAKEVNEALEECKRVY